jgi:hypothetical protein
MKFCKGGDLSPSSYHVHLSLSSKQSMTLAHSWSRSLILVAVTAAALVTSALPSLAAADSKDPVLEIRIEQTGKTVVRGATVTAVASSTITATTPVGPSLLTWTIGTDSSTDYLRQSGGNAARTDIVVGDKISFSGKISSTSPLMVQADTVKDFSPATSSAKEKRAHLEGEVISIDASNNRFVFEDEKEGNVTAQLASSTSLIRNGVSSFLSFLAVGDEVKVSGMFKADTDVIAAEKVTVKGEDSQGKKRGFWRSIGDRIQLRLNFNR